jgi:hypothetical protein
MGVGEYHTRIFLACLLSIQITITFFGPLHFYLLRKGARKRITCALWSDVFFVSGWVIVMGLGWYIIRRCVVGEIRVRQIAANELEVMMYFATETVGKV